MTAVSGEVMPADRDYQSLVESSGQGMARLELDGRPTYLNPSLRRMLGLAPTDPAADLAPDTLATPEDLASARNTGGWCGERWIVARDGRHTPALLDIRLVLDAGDVPRAFALSVTDLSQQKHRERSLLDSEMKYRVLAENIPQRVFYKDEHSRYVAVNRRYAMDLGMRAEDIVGQDDLAFFPDSLAAKYREDDRRVMNTGHAEEFDERYWRNGQEVTIHIVKTPVRGERGQVVGVCGIFWDVSEQRLLENALRRSEEVHAQAESLAHVGSWDWDIMSGDLHWTGEVYRIFGEAPRHDVVTYLDFLEAIHPEDRDRVTSAINACLADASASYNVEHRVVRPDGEVRVVHERGKVYRDAAGLPTRMIGTVHDITERKRAEIELLHNRERLENLVRERTSEAALESRRNAIIVNAAMDGFFSADQSGHLVDCNDVYCRMLGYSREEMLNLYVMDLEANETAEETAAHMRHILAHGHDRFDSRHRRKDGGILDVEVSVTLAEVGGASLFFAFVSDITRRKQAKQALHESEARLRMALDAAYLISFDWDIVRDEEIGRASCRERV